MIHNLRIARTPAQRAKLLAFKPVPREKPRSDGWTPERQRAFVEALADCGIVSRAAKMVGMSSEGAYALRRHPHGRSFSDAWTRAQDVGVQRLSDLAFERAIEGVPVPVYYQGAVVGERRWYDNRLLMYVLRHNDPDRYGTGSPAYRLSPATVAKLRAEWEQERLMAESAKRKSRHKDLSARLEGLYQNILARERAEWERAAPERERKEREAHEARLAERAAVGLFGPVDPLNLRPPLPPHIPSPHAKPGHEWPRGWGPQGRRPLEPDGPAIRAF